MAKVQADAQHVTSSTLLDCGLVEYAPRSTLTSLSGRGAPWYIFTLCGSSVPQPDRSSRLAIASKPNGQDGPCIRGKRRRGPASSARLIRSGCEVPTADSGGVISAPVWMGWFASRSAGGLLEDDELVLLEFDRRATTACGGQFGVVFAQELRRAIRVPLFSHPSSRHPSTGCFDFLRIEGKSPDVCHRAPFRGKRGDIGRLDHCLVDLIDAVTSVGRRGIQSDHHESIPDVDEMAILEPGKEAPRCSVAAPRRNGCLGSALRAEDNDGVSGYDLIRGIQAVGGAPGQQQAESRDNDRQHPEGEPDIDNGRPPAAPGGNGTKTRGWHHLSFFARFACEPVMV